MLHLSGDDIHLFLDDLNLSLGAASVGAGHHCVFLIDGAQLTAQGCSFSSPMAPSIAATGQGTEVNLTGCLFGPDKAQPASAGVVIDSGARLSAESCLLQHCKAPAVEIRGSGSEASLDKCIFVKCKAQAVLLYSEGKSLVMRGCDVRECGTLPIFPGMTVSSGSAAVSDCRFLDNTSEAIVVQPDPGDSTSASLELRGSILSGNMGGVMFGHVGCWDPRTAATKGGGMGYLVDNLFR